MLRPGDTVSKRNTPHSAQPSRSVAPRRLVATRGGRLLLAVLAAQLVFSAGVAFAQHCGESQKVLASDGAAGDCFGYSVALSGQKLIIGAPRDDDTDTSTGSAYVFALLNAGTWSQEGKLNAADAAFGDELGSSVTMNGDWAIAGAPRDDDGGTSAGSAYLFLRTFGTWSQSQKFTASTPDAQAMFGFSVDMTADTAIIGAKGDNDTGAAYAFVDAGFSWTEQQKLNGSDSAASDNFGYSVAVDGDTALVGAYGNGGTGAAYVFFRVGGVWSEQQKLTASDAASGDRFGYSVALEGDTAVVGAYFDDSSAGAAYVFTRSGSVWTEQQKLTASDAAADDFFGGAVALSGNTALVGAYQEDDGGDAAGATYVFTRSGTTWSERQKLVASDAAAADWYGFALALSGSRALVGVYKDVTGVDDTGSTWVVGCPAAHGDLSGDVIADLMVVRDSNHTTYWLSSESDFTTLDFKRVGVDGDVHLMADMDGDRQLDPVIWRPSNGLWAWLEGDTVVAGPLWGSCVLGDTPLLADMDGDGKADPVVWRTTTGYFLWLESSAGFARAAYKAALWGSFFIGDQPFLADLDGDGKADPIVWRDGTWFWLKSKTGYSRAFGDYGFKSWGVPGDVPLVAQMTPDGVGDLVVWRRDVDPEGRAQFFWTTSETDFSDANGSKFGSDDEGDIPVILGLDADAYGDLAVWRQARRTWFWTTYADGYDRYLFQSAILGVPSDKVPDNRERADGAPGYGWNPVCGGGG